jgi:glycosyltransferase involved in cell wall biosynthesis
LLRASIPNLRAWILGPTEEDKDYFHECQSLVEQLGLQSCVSFLGKVRLDEYLGKIDVIVLTSLSEAQPLVILEAGAAGIPSVATNVGACSELILGGQQEKPPLGAGGAITPLANPAATAEALRILLTNAEWYQSCSRNTRERVRNFYNRSDLDGAYRTLYADCCSASEAAPYDLARAC